MIRSDGQTLSLAKQYARQKSREKRLCCANCGGEVALTEGAYICGKCYRFTGTLLDLALVEAWS